MIGEIDVEDSIFAYALNGQALVFARLRQRFTQTPADGVQSIVNSILPKLRQRGQSGGAGNWVSVQRPDLVNIIIRGHRGSIVHRHNIGTTHRCGQRVPATHDLAYRTQVGRYAVILLSATVGQAESRNHFVKDEQQVGVSGEFPETG